MSLSYSLPRQLAGRNEHEIGRIIDAEVRAALRDIATWPERMSDPNWCQEIDQDLRPSEDGNNGERDGAEASAKRERTNAARRQKYAAKSKEG